MSQFFGILVGIVYLGDMESYSLKIHTCWGNGDLRHDVDGFKGKGFLLSNLERNDAAALGPALASGTGWRVNQF